MNQSRQSEGEMRTQSTERLDSIHKPWTRKPQYELHTSNTPIKMAHIDPPLLHCPTFKTKETGKEQRTSAKNQSGS